MTSTDHNEQPGIAEHVATFEDQGYLHLRQVFSAEQITEYHHLRDRAVRDWQFTAGRAEVPDAVEGLVERYPRAGLTIVAHPLLLGIAEELMGPVVQLDSAVLAGDPPVDPRYRGQPVAWHRDRFGFFPTGAYTRPLSIIVLIYLQAMTDDVGPLRVVPGSHIEPVVLSEAQREVPHPHEVLVRTAPGDAVMVHHNLLHSGTRNTSAHERRFVGLVYNISGLIHQDTFAGPNCQALIATARRTNDRRMLRLLGQDPLIIPRQNSGFRQPSEQSWRTWHQEDQAYAAQAATERATVDRVRASCLSNSLSAEVHGT
jgi:hypothetical protein